MATRRFDRGSFLAWSLERGGGYRETAKVEWQFVSLDGCKSNVGESVEMIAPVDDQQYSSIHEGRLVLLEPPAVTGRELSRDSGGDFIRLAAARRRIGWL